MEHMSALDASFLEVENAVTHMHIGSIAVLEGPAPEYEQLRAGVLAKLPLVPRYRQVVRNVALWAGRPVWVDDQHFNLDYHLRRTALPAPGGEPELRRLVGRVMSQQLDRAKPLWEMWVVEGLEGGRWAVVSKIHHCMVDGVAGSDLLTVIFDREPVPDREPVSAPSIGERWQPAPAPGGIDLMARALLLELRVSLEALGALGSPRALARRTEEAGLGLARMRHLLRPTERSSLNGPLGPHRRWSWARAELADVGEIRAALGGTVNDVVLAGIAGGFRTLLRARGEPVDRVLRSMVPVSVRLPGEHGTYNNRVSAVFVELPVGSAEPRERLADIRRQTENLKSSRQAVAGEVLTSLSGFAPPLLLALGERLAARVPQHNINTVTTNVPGPQYPLYLGDRRMLEAFPYVPLGGSVRVGVAIYSYDRRLAFGVTGDYDAAPDVDVLCEGIEAALAELLALARPPRPHSRTRARRSSASAAAPRPARRAAGGAR